MTTQLSMSRILDEFDSIGKQYADVHAASFAINIACQITSLQRTKRSPSDILSSAVIVRRTACVRTKPLRYDLL